MLLKRVKELVNDLEGGKKILEDKFLYTSMTLEEMDYYSNFYTDEINNYIKANYPEIKNNLVTITIHPNLGIMFGVDLNEHWN